VARNRLRRALEQAAGSKGTPRSAARRANRKRELACV
jgi:hypothetical protein